MPRKPKKKKRQFLPVGWLAWLLACCDMEPPEDPPLTFEHIPGDLVLHMCRWLAPADVGRLGRVSRAMHAHSEMATRRLVLKIWRDVLPRARDVPLRLVYAAFAQDVPLRVLHAAFAHGSVPLSAGCPLDACGGSVCAPRSRTGPIRCACAALRTKLPLTLGCFDEGRGGSSCLGGGGFDELLTTLSHSFKLKLVQSSQLTPDSLRPLDALLLCTTEGTALAEDELTALQAWVRAGGSLIVSAFAHW